MGAGGGSVKIEIPPWYGSVSCIEAVRHDKVLSVLSTVFISAGMPVICIRYWPLYRTWLLKVGYKGYKGGRKT